MNQYKYLMKNTFFFAFSSLFVKIISFLLLPLYTSILTTTEYGKIDLINTFVSLILPILTLSIAESALRFAFIEKTNKKSVFTSGLLINITGIILLFLFIPILIWIKSDVIDYFTYIFLLFFTSSIEQFFLKFNKGLENIKICAISSIIVIFVTVFVNMILLVVFDLGLNGYLVSIILAQLISSIYLFYAGKLINYLDFKSIDKSLILEMLLYSIPFIPSTIAWWINSAADRITISILIGVNANGLYSVASKLPSLVTVFSSIFHQAFQISGIKEFENKNYDSFYSNIYNVYNSFLVILVSFIILILPFLSKFLFSGTFYSAWIYAPFLLLSSLFSGLAGLLSTLYFAIKKTNILMISTLIGASVNIILNIFLVSYIGVQGATIATAISFFIVWIIRFKISMNYISLKNSFLISFFSYLILIIQSILIIFKTKYNLIINFIFLLYLVFINRKEIVKFFDYVFVNNFLFKKIRQLKFKEKI